MGAVHVIAGMYRPYILILNDFLVTTHMAGLGTLLRTLGNTLFGDGSTPSTTTSMSGITPQMPYKKGDIVVFSFLPQPELSGKRFEIIHAAAYDISGEQHASYTIKNEAGDVFYLADTTEEGETYVGISRKLKRGDALDTFGEADIGAVFDEGFSKLHTVSHPSDTLQPWLADSYHEVSDCTRGAYYTNGVIAGEGERFDYYALEDGSESFAVEIEVYDGGETDISLTVYHTKSSAISEHWPAA